MQKNLFMPVGMRKDKKLEEVILASHKKLAGMSESTAKLKYVQLVRALKTYGFTYFHGHVKDAKQRPIPLCLGISKNGISKMDPDSMK